MPVAADITKIEAPVSAIEGEQVSVDVTIKNISSSEKYLTVTGVFDSTELPFQFDYVLAAPGQMVLFPSSFTMPAKTVKVTVWGWYWTGIEWVLDDTVTKNIALSVLTPEFSSFNVIDYVTV